MPLCAETGQTPEDSLVPLAHWAGAWQTEVEGRRDLDHLLPFCKSDDRFDYAAFLEQLRLDEEEAARQAALLQAKAHEVPARTTSSELAGVDSEQQQQQRELSAQREAAKRLFLTQARGWLLRAWAQSQYVKTRSRLQRARPGVAEDAMNYAVNEVPVDLDKYIESVRQAGLDPKQLLAASGFNSKQVQMVLDACKEAERVSVISRGTDLASLRSSGDGLLDGCLFSSADANICSISESAAEDAGAGDTAATTTRSHAAEPLSLQPTPPSGGGSPMHRPNRSRPGGVPSMLSSSCESDELLSNLSIRVRANPPAGALSSPSLPAPPLLRASSSRGLSFSGAAGMSVGVAPGGTTPLAPTLLSFGSCSPSRFLPPAKQRSSVSGLPSDPGSGRVSTLSIVPPGSNTRSPMSCSGSAPTSSQLRATLHRGTSDTGQGPTTLLPPLNSPSVSASGTLSTSLFQFSPGAPPRSPLPIKPSMLAGLSQIRSPSVPRVAERGRLSMQSSPVRAPQRLNSMMLETSSASKQPTF